MKETKKHKQRLEFHKLTQFSCDGMCANNSLVNRTKFIVRCTFVHTTQCMPFKMKYNCDKSENSDNWIVIRHFGDVKIKIRAPLIVNGKKEIPNRWHTSEKKKLGPSSLNNIVTFLFLSSFFLMFSCQTYHKT